MSKRGGLSVRDILRLARQLAGYDPEFSDEKAARLQAEYAATNCTHARQEWQGLPLPCAYFGCVDGVTGYDWIVMERIQPLSFRAWDTEPLPMSITMPRRYRFVRVELREPGARESTWHWENTEADLKFGGR